MFPKRPDAFELLTGRLSNDPHPGGISLPGEGGKFSTDGVVQNWPGNTFICHVDPTSDAWRVIREVQEKVKCSPFHRFFTFTPPSSFHMTVFQGICPVVRGDWPEGVPEDASRDRVSGVLLERTRGLDVPTSFKVQVNNLHALHSLSVTGADEENDALLRKTREILRAATGISPKGFEDYVFHITLGYPVTFASDSLAKEMVDFSQQISSGLTDAIGTIDLGPLEFCTFETMHHFEPLVKLGA
ncbi:MAG: DUF1868 domain-containing protein [Rhodobacteraceae bacterium]|nr:DUF1868 domain-containing protein [Paracoccaceae bacterium]